MNQRTILWAHFGRFISIVLALLFLALVLRGSWLADDAYITFRTVDNVANGYGPVWNTDERVQGFTNPLWMGVLSFIYLFSGEIFFTAHLTQLTIVFWLALILVFKVARTRWRGVLLMSVLMLSKAFVDFSSSGLENALLHLILTYFFLVFLDSESPKRLLYLTLLAALGALTRLDAAVIMAIPLGYEIITQFRRHGGAPQWRRQLLFIVLGLLPLILWELFSLFYYGFPFPNTAYSKLGTQIPIDELVVQGFFYLNNSLTRDPVTLLAIVMAVTFAIIEGSTRQVIMAAGVLVHLAYVVRVGGDFMSGRFLSVPFLVAVIILTRISLAGERRYLAAVSAAFLVASSVAFFPTLNKDYHTHFRSKDAHGIVDACRTGTVNAGLLNTSREKPLPQNEWVERGQRYRKKKEQYPTGGGIGYTGYYAGPLVHIIDIYGLTEPLLARFPTGKPVHGKKWRIGHFRRQLPEKYRETLITDRNVIADPHLAKYYDKLKLITRGELFSGERLVAILKMNLGSYNHWLETFVAAHPDLWLFPKPPTHKR